MIRRSFRGDSEEIRRIFRGDSDAIQRRMFGGNSNPAKCGTVLAYSMHTCNVILNNLNDMEDDQKPPTQTHHREEMRSRMRMINEIEL